jgi:autotransporter-associated beta strand protein
LQQALAGISDLKLPKPGELRWKEPVSELVFEEFRRWTEGLPAARQGASLQRGMRLAKQRRSELLRLIEKNPQRALELAVPHSVRQQLPNEIVALLEERVDAQGDLLVQSTTLENNRGCMMTRAATLQDGKVFDVHTYGRRSAMPTRDNIAIHGVALDGKLALSEFPGRVLEPSEVAARVELGQAVGESQEPTDAADGLVIAFGDDLMIRYPDETQAVAALLLAEGEEQSGATATEAADLDGVIAASPWTEGQKTLLIIRVDFPDAQGQVVSDATLGQLIADMNGVYTDMSSGKASFALLGQGSHITPTVRMPKNSSNYGSWTSLSKVLDDARVAASAAGYNYQNFTHEVVVTGAVPLVAGTAGVARVGARGAWLHNSQWNLKTCAHEVGHNFGLPHSGAWDTDDGSVIGPGKAWDYGNVFDFMGVGPSPHSSRHFGASVKQFLDWMPVSDVVKITSNGTTTTRIRAMDKVQADGNKRALVVDRPGSSDDYWIEHRQLYGTNHGMRDGVLVNWASINGGYQQPLLLDMKPETFEKTDAVLPLGKTFSDAAAAIHVTPVARGTDPDGVNWIDVSVSRGSVAGNLKPVASLSATNANPALNASVTFTCTASDPNGDALAYFWDWGNGTTTANNSPTASKSWSTSGVYVVQCTVSDMKGLTTTADYVIQVGATGTFFIEGMVRTPLGTPLQGVVVTASPAGLKATSDASGRYIITGLAAGTYTLISTSGTPDGFTNPVTVGPSLQKRNFVRPSYPLTWDADSALAGAQDGGGTWANSTGNWQNDATSANNRTWVNASMDAATFGAGADGSYAVTLSGAVQAGGGISFANSGYTLSGTALLLHDGTNNTSVTVAAGKSATLNSAITYQNNKPAAITVNSGAVLNLGGGASNSQYNFSGVGTVNMTAGAYHANVGSMAIASFNQSGGTFTITPGNNVGYNVSSNSRSVNFALSGGTLTVNGNASTATVNNAYLGIGNGTAISHTSTMTVKSGATVDIGTTSSRSGELRIGNTPESNGTLDVQGGVVTIGTGNPANKIYFFKAGTIDAPYLASMTQSGGTVTTNGIQFGGDSGSHDPASSAVLQLSGGGLYIGAQGITRGSAAADLAVEIQLQGGTLGASQNWSSSLNMQLGTGLTLQAEDSVGVARNITLTGNLSDDGELSGSLTKTGLGLLTLGGANTFTGGVTIKNGTLESRATTNTLGSGTVTMGGSGSSGATFITGQNNSNSFVINAPNSGDIVIGTNSGGSGFTMSGGITLNGNLTLQTFNNTISGSIKSSGGFTGGITGTGNLLLNNLGLAANTLFITANAVNHTGTITLQGTATGDTTISAPIGANVTDVTQNSATSTLVISGNNAYCGATTISAGTLRLGAANVIPDGSGKGDVAVTGTLDLNGFSETINGLTGAGTVNNTAVSTPATLTVTTSSVFHGILQNTGAALALVKAGNSDFTLAGNNTYNGGTTINAGRLFISSAGALSRNGPLQINHGGGLHLIADGTPAYNQSITLASGGRLAMRKAATLTNVSLPTSGSVVFNSDDQNTVEFSLNGNISLNDELTVQVGGGGGSPGAVTLAGAISGSGGLDKTKVGTLILTGFNSYAGATKISEGMLALDGGSTASPITVLSGAKLGFTLGSSVTSTATLTFAPGHSIHITGTPLLGSYTLFTTVGSITGTPALTVPIPGYQLRVVGGNQLRLVQATGSPYAEWSGGAAFDADANGDGVTNGLAFLLGALDKDVNAVSLLPVSSYQNGDLVLSFSMLNAANRGSASLSIQHSRDLGVNHPWTTVTVPDAADGPTAGVTFNVVVGVRLNRVTASISSSEAGGGGKLFGRLHAAE